MSSACICVKEFRAPNQLLRTVYTWRAHFQENGTLFLEEGVDETGTPTPPQSIDTQRGQWVEMIVVDTYPQADEVIREMDYPAPALAAAFPPCTHVMGMCLTYECPEAECPNN